MKIIRTDNAPAPVEGAPYSQGMCTEGGGRTLYVSGQVPSDRERGEIVSGDITAQT